MKLHVDQKYNFLKDEMIESFQAIRGIVKEVKNDELNDLSIKLVDSVSDPFMFVIVGEVKAGKSSFINALLDTEKEICKVAPSPMTDTIQEITYGEEKIEFVNPYLKKIYQPVEILKEFSIVDTPGTNTIVKHHQEITERFIPSSDLIVFVFEAKNPYRQSAWEFFDFINEEWRKKIIFVLQQKDLLNEQDLEINIKGVIDHAEKKGIVNPKVFAVSAKQEIEGQNKISGYIVLRKYLSENITGGQTPFLKLQSIVNSAQQIMGRLGKGIMDRKAQFELDVAFRGEIRDTLDQQEGKSVKKVKNLVENLLNAYDKVTLTKVNELNEGLSFIPVFRRSFSSLIGSTKPVKHWLTEVQTSLEMNLNKELRDKLQEGVIDIADSIQNMGKIVDLKLKASQTVLKNDHEIFSDIAEKRANVLKDLQNAFSSFLSSSENYYDDNLMEGSNITPNLAAGGGIAIVGVIITTVTNLAVFDITGGILTATGVILAGFSLGVRKRKIIRSVKEEIGKGRERIRTEISEKLEQYIHRIKTKIDENFDRFDILLKNEKKALDEILSKETGINENLATYSKRLLEILKN